MKYTKNLVMMPLMVEVDENGKVGSLEHSSIADVQAALDGGRTALTRLPTTDTKAPRHLRSL